MAPVYLLTSSFLDLFGIIEFRISGHLGVIEFSESRGVGISEFIIHGRLGIIEFRHSLCPWQH